MTQTTLSPDELKSVLKAALVEAFQEQRGLLHEVFAEVLEDFALAEAIREGAGKKRVERDEVFRLLRDGE